MNDTNEQLHEEPNKKSEAELYEQYSPEKLDKADELKYQIKELQDEVNDEKHDTPHLEPQKDKTNKIYNNKAIQKIFGKCSEKTPLSVPLYYFNMIMITLTLVMVEYDFYLMMSTDGFVFTNFLREVAFFTLIYLLLRNTYRNYYFYKLNKK